MRYIWIVICAMVVFRGGFGLAAEQPGADLCDGEAYVAEWLKPSGFDTSFSLGETLFSGDTNGGGDVSVTEFPARSGNKALLIRETSTSGAASNRGSSFRWSIGRNTPFCRRVNEILAKPEGQEPVFFCLSFRFARKHAASRLIHAGISAEWQGAERPARYVLQGHCELPKLSNFLRHDDFTLVNAGLMPPLRFAVYPSGGKHQVNGIDFRFNIRVEGDSSNEEIVVDDLAIYEVASSAKPTASRRTIAFVGSAPSTALLAAAWQAQYRVLPTMERLDEDADVYVIDRRLDDDQLAKQCVQALDKGKSLVICLTDAPAGIPSALEECLPINTWSCSRWNLQRGDTVLKVRPDSVMAKAGITGSLSLGKRVDLHLPYAPIETSLQRYEWDRYGKPLLNTDWRVLLNCDTDSGLPALVVGRCGPGRVLVFAGSLSDPLLMHSAGYAKLVQGLVKLAGRPRIASSRNPNIDIAVAQHQPDGLHVKLTNKDSHEVEAMLVYKVRNWARELRNSSSVKVKIPANGQITVPLRERSSEIGDYSIASSCEENVPLTRLEVGIAPLNRSKVVSQRSAVVSRNPAVSITFEEDAKTFDEMKDWPTGQASFDGSIGYRYVYRTGTPPRLQLKLRNGLFNVAPLARAKDLRVPENWSANGLNDLSYTHASVRGAVPLQGGWSGSLSAEQRIGLAWDSPVLIKGYRLVGQGTYRHWNDSNPRNFALLGKEGKKEFTIDTQKDAGFDKKYGDILAYCAKDLKQPVTVERCRLDISGLNPSRQLELKHWKTRGREEPSNCTLLEWEVLGWPHRQMPPAVKGAVKVVMHDLLSGQEKVLLDESVEVAGMDESIRDLTIPAKSTFGPVRIDATFSTDKGTMTKSSFDVLFVPAEGKKMVNKESMIDWQRGLLCTPGWVQADDFGKGIEDQTRGWGGPDDKIWAFTNNLMEIGSRNRDAANRMFTSCTGASHYTNPWRNMPNGVYSWDMVSSQMLGNLVKGGCWNHMLKDRNGDGKLRVHVIGSDRWNGTNIGAAWGWGEFMAFDKHLRSKGEQGLQGRTISAIVKEVRENHGKEWQVWQLERYADKLIETQEAFKKKGIDFTFETHGSFPLCGGELGEKLARTHIAVGTDLFWELRNQDLIWSLGTRFAIVAANPNLRSGAYNQWGWVNSEANKWWFANNSSVEPARRQWYATYFVGRITLDGRFEPYHVYGFSSQGGAGTQMNPDDIEQQSRTVNFTTQVRPERATGFGMVVSWANQERRMGKKLGRQGFGLYAGKGHEQVDMLMANVYHKLAKNGLPISFFTSTHGLKNKNGTEPLVLVDGYNLSDWELAAVRRLNASGTPILAIGAPEAGRDLSGSSQFYGVSQQGREFVPAADVRTVQLQGGIEAFVKVKPGAGPVVYVPVEGKDLPNRSASALVREVMALVGEPLTLPLSIAASPFVSQGCLFLPLIDQGDDSRQITVQIRPEWFLSTLKGKKLQVVDLDRAVPIQPQDLDDGRLKFRLQVPATSGRMIMISEGGR